MPAKTVSRDRYVAALGRIEDSLSERELSFLRAHYHSPEHTATATTLALAAGFSEYRVTNLLYGKLAARLEAAFTGALPRSHYGIGILARDGGKTPAGHWRLQMRPELVDALDEVGWCVGGAPPELSRDGPSDLTATEVEALRAARLGQGCFRAGVVAYWQACSVTGCGSLQLLTASHIKPWSASTNAERLDPYNGLLLTPNLHALFDLGIISFADDGTILISRRADPAMLHSLHVVPESRITRLTLAHIKYLKYHRKHFFLP